jgi:2',3'-cyclic-nucleotide 2'-phosphodiesterase (5'-nucleotidase family)
LALLISLGIVAADAAARQIDITILHTTDLHGFVLPTTDYEGRKNVGGLLRCATLIRRLREANPKALLIDCGDLFQGAPESFLTDGRIMMRALEHLRYDAWIVGNHEFDWGLPVLSRLHDMATVPIVAANIVARPKRPHPFPKMRPFILRDVDGVRVAIVGLITPGVPTWSTPDLLGDCLFERSTPALQRIMPWVRAEEPDVWILATHQGYKRQGDDHANEINEIARAFPEFDAIIGGHTHEPVPEVWLDGRTLYSQAGYYGIWLGQVDLTYDTVARRVVRKSARLHEADESVPRDAELEALLAPDLRRAEDYLAQLVGRATAPIGWQGDDYGRSPMQALLARALAKASGADLVLHGILSEQELPAGEIRMADIWRIVPYENRIAVFHVTPAELIEILDENARQRRRTSFMGLHGASYEWEFDPEGGRRAARVRLASGVAPHPKTRLSLAVNSYVVASGGRRHMRLREIAEQPAARLRILDIDTRRAVIDFIRAHSPLDPDRLLRGAP